MIVLVAAISVVYARPASADICTDPPSPVQPKSGLPGMLTMTPKHIPDKAPNPFKDPSVSIGQVYGYNWNWANYDLGCGPDFLRDPIAVTNTESANVILSFVGAILAGLASLEQMASSSSLNWLSNVVGGIAGKLRTPVLSLWLPLAMLGVGLMVAFRSKRTSYAETMRTVLVIALAGGLTVLALVFPAVASNAVDNAVVSVSKAAGAQFSASPSDAVTRGSAYRAWLTGNFGDPDSAEAKKFGPELMDATHYSWSDMKQIQADPASKKQIDNAKAAEFKSIAAQLKQQDPSGYNEFTGRGERTGPALFAIVVALAMSLFVAIAMIMVLVSRLMMQGLALAAPLAAVVGVMPTHRSALSRMWDLFAAALVTVAKFVIAGGVMTTVLGAIESNNNLGAGAQLFWIVVATVVGLILTRPIHSFKSVVPGLDPNRSYIRTALSGVTSYFGARFGAEEAIADHAGGDQPTTALPDQVPTPRASQTAQESLPALPSPSWQTPELTWIDQRTAGLAPGPQRAALDRAWPGVVSARATAELPPAQRQLDVVSEPRAVNGTALDVSSRRLSLPAGSVTSNGSVISTGSVISNGSLSLSKGETDTRPELTSAPTIMDSPETEAPDDGFGHRPIASANGSDVVYPTGIIVADEGIPMYHRSGDEAGASETYIPASDLELAEDGSQHELVTYHSRMRVAHATA